MQDAFRRLALDVIMEAGFGIKTDAMLPTAASAKNELLTQMDNAPWCAEPLLLLRVLDKTAQRPQGIDFFSP